jgi:hypothetical protein
MNYLNPFRQKIMKWVKELNTSLQKALFHNKYVENIVLWNQGF